jgi:hypothetical protein
MTLLEIDSIVQTYADRREMLAGSLMALERALTVVKRQHLRHIKRQVALTAECETDLRNAIEAAPELFDKPKTQILHGIKVGFRKGKGKIEWEDDGALVALLKKKYPDEVDQLIITTEKPSKAGLQDLDAAELRRLGVTVEDTDDQVVVKAVESDVEKLVKLLLKDAMDDVDDAA